MNEGGSGTYNIFLDTLPVDPTTGNPSSVTVTITQPSNTDITTTNSVTLNSSNWDTGATVMVEVADDADTTADSATLTHTVTGADYAGASVNNVVVTANDLDTEGVSISETGVTPTEGSTATYQVNLNTQPTGTVTVTPSSDNSNVTFAPANLTFTSSTWNTLQTVTVTAEEDADAAVDTATITHTVSGAEYNSAPKPGDVAVTVTENDSLDIMVSPTTREIDEVQGGTGTATYEVELAAAPTGGVVTIVMTVTGDANVTTSPNPLTFSASDWATPTTASFSQTVTVNVSEDPDATDLETATIQHAVQGSSDYATTAGIVAADVVVTVNDTDTRGVTISQASLTVAEGSTGTYTVKLDTEPTGDVTVTINDPTDNTVITADEPSLTFDATTWLTPQSVTVSERG